MRFVKWIAAFAAVSVLAGCASQPEIPFDKSANGTIRKIGILTPGMPEKPNIWLASDIGQSFGLIGALVDASMQEARNTKVWAMLVDRKMVPRNEFVGDLEDSLRAQGYDATFVRVNRSQGDYLKTYPSAAETGVDAYLDISGINYGYVAAGIGKSTPYRPFVYTTFRLVRASDGVVLMQDAIYYDPVAPFGQGKNITISPDPNYTFVDFDAMKGDPTQTVAGLNASFRSTTDAMSHLLR